MSLPDDLPTAFAAFRDETRAELAAVRAVAETARSETQFGRVNAGLLQALRETQVEHGTQIAELRSDVTGLLQGQMMLATDQVHLTLAVEQLQAGQAELTTGQAQLTLMVEQLRTGQVALWGGLDEVRADVADLKTDVADLKTDVADLKTGMAEVLRRLPPPPAA